MVHWSVRTLRTMEDNVSDLSKHMHDMWASTEYTCSGRLSPACSSTLSGDLPRSK
jgi:hypothetical protein